MKAKLLKGKGSRWGPGKVHRAVRLSPGNYVVACTEKSIYADLIDGEDTDVTCKNCIRRRR